MQDMTESLLTARLHLNRRTNISYEPSLVCGGGWLDIGPVRLLLPHGKEEREEVLSVLDGAIALAQPQPADSVQPEPADTRDVVRIERHRSVTGLLWTWQLSNSRGQRIEKSSPWSTREDAVAAARVIFATRPNTSLELGE